MFRAVTSFNHDGDSNPHLDDEHVTKCGLATRNRIHGFSVDGGLPELIYDSTADSISEVLQSEKMRFVASSVIILTVACAIGE